MNSYYIQTNLICLIQLVGLMTLLYRKKVAIPAQQLAFIRLILCAIVICISDIFAWTCDGKTFAGARTILELSNMIYYCAITWTCCLWLNYVMIFIYPLDYNYKKKLILSTVPAVLMTVIVLLNPMTQWLFSIDGDNVYSRGNGIILHWFISWGYLFFATGLTLHCMRISKTKMVRKRFYPLFSFIVLPVIGAVAQMLFYGVTAAQCGIVLSIIMIGFGTMREQISSDTLTGLNNRKALENYLSNRLQKQGQLFYVIFCDIDHFKSINDTFGHAKGDLALKRAAEALRQACGRAPEPLFLCRYGGDEFVICGVEISAETVDAFAANLREELAALNTQFQGEHPIDISIGAACGLCDSEDDVELLIHEADTSMYEVKNGKR